MLCDVLDGKMRNRSVAWRMLCLYTCHKSDYLLCHIDLDKEGEKRSKDDLVPALTCDRLPRLDV